MKIASEVRLDNVWKEGDLPIIAAQRESQDRFKFNVYHKLQFSVLSCTLKPEFEI